MKSIKNVGAILIACQKNPNNIATNIANNGGDVGAGGHPCPARDTSPKNNHGITLIALVVTIIVLLILAGVSLNLIAGSNGILGRATTAINQTKVAAEEERRELARAEALMNYSNETYTDKSGDTAIIPAGFAPTGIDGETEIDEGLVITDPDGNEFVWIPVANETAYVKTIGSKNWKMKSGSSGWDSDVTEANAISGDILGLDNILGTTVTSTLASYPEKSVAVAAKGFWVSRYEVGIDTGTRTGDEIYADTLGAGDLDSNGWYDEEFVSKQGMQPVRYIFQQDALKIANSWKTTSSVQSGLITGTQWDLMCQFIGWDETNADCGTWGNYWNVASASYSDLWHSKDGDTQAHGCEWIHFPSSSDAVAKIAKGKSDSPYTRWVFPTGTFITENGKNTAKKNIYDVAGNVYEWTTEQSKFSTTTAVLRGMSAYHNSGDWAAIRDGGNSASTIRSWNFGLRLVLYVSL